MYMLLFPKYFFQFLITKSKTTIIQEVEAIQTTMTCSPHLFLGFVDSLQQHIFPSFCFPSSSYKTDRCGSSDAAGDNKNI